MEKKNENDLNNPEWLSYEDMLKRKQKIAEEKKQEKARAKANEAIRDYVKNGK